MDIVERHIGSMDGTGIFNRAAARERRFLEQEQVRDRERRRKEGAEKDGEDDLFALAAVSIEEQVRRLSSRIDRYETATVAALQRNERELADARARLTALLENAHVLPDGRRVFRTEDGSRVYDEHGNELSEEEIDPASIPDGRTTWEAFQNVIEERDHLLQERQDLLEYQERLDEARGDLEDGELSGEELDDIEAELEALMPEAVRGELHAAGRDREWQAGRPERADAGSGPPQHGQASGASSAPPVNP